MLSDALTRLVQLALMIQVCQFLSLIDEGHSPLP